MWRRAMLAAIAGLVVLPARAATRLPGVTCDVESRLRLALDENDESVAQAAATLHDDGREIVLAFRVLAPALREGGIASRLRASRVLIGAYDSVIDVPDEAFDPIDDALRHADVLGRAIALDVLEECTEDRAQELAAFALDDPSAWVRAKAVDVLESWMPSDLTPLTIRALEREAGRRDERLDAAFAMSDPSCADPYVLSCLTEMTDRETAATDAAVRLLARLHPEPPPPPEDDDAPPPD